MIACSPPDRRPEWEATRKRLVWPNGAEAQVFSAHDPDSMRGPQFDAAWVDELAKWKRAEEAWDMLQFALRLGDASATGGDDDAAECRGVEGDLEEPFDRGDPCADRGEPRLSGEIVSGRGAGALCRHDEGAAGVGRGVDRGCRGGDVDAGRRWLWRWCEDVPELSRVVVAVDPPVTGHAGSDECGILVVGAVTEGPPQDWHAVCLEDASVRAASPDAWARAAIAAMQRHGAERVVAEVNQGGDMVETVIRQVDPLVSYRAVRATRGKAVRAEPVAALV